MSHFQFGSPAAWLLTVVLPLAALTLFHRRWMRPTPVARSSSLGRRALTGLLLLSLIAFALGIGLCLWVIVGTDEIILFAPLVITGLACLAVPILLGGGMLLGKRRNPVCFRHPTTHLMAKLPAGHPSTLRHLVGLARWLALGLLVFVLARPQTATVQADQATEGMDIVLVLDVSTSMRAVDFAPPELAQQPLSRIDGAKETLTRFIRQRGNDRLGLVVFAAEAFTQCPLTLDTSVLQTILQTVETGAIQDGTAIGNALAVGVNRLRGSDAKSKVIILVTDGDDNASTLSPTQAAEIATQQGIQVFPILVGKGGLVPFPAGPDIFGQMQYRKGEIRTNPELLQDIARIANGHFYRAVDQKGLEEDLQSILDHMEKTHILDPGRFTRANEEFQPWLLGALVLILFELLLRWTRFREFP